jgi:tetratricopeptide (TPR) repeat protein
MPDDPEALRLAARAAARQDRDRAAIPIYTRLGLKNMEPVDYFLMGRALSRTGQLEPAFQSFEKALAGNPNDPETLDMLGRIYYQEDLFYAAEDAALRLARQPGWEARGQLMLGTVRAELEDPAGVAAALGRWSELDPEGRSAAPDPVRPIQLLRARSLLRSKQPAETRRLLEKILESGGDREASWLLSRACMQEGDWGGALAIWKQDPRYRAQNATKPEPAPFTGQASCKECHPTQYQAVLASRHSATFFRARELKNFPLPKEPLPDPANPQVTHEFKRDGDTIHVATRTAERVYKAVIDYAFGSRTHFTSYVGRDESNRTFMLRMSSYETARGLSWDLSTGLPAHPSEAEDYLGAHVPDGDGARRCLVCHTTSFRAAANEVGPEAADHSIGCEKCHGPGGHHLAAVDAEFPDLAIACPSGTPPAQLDAVCARCHSRARLEGITTARTDPFWYRFQSLSLTWSRCYSESNGMLGCTTCHDPHRDVETSTTRNEAKCLSCHAGKPGAPSVPAGSADTTVQARRADPVPLSGKVQHKESKTPCPVNPVKGCLECHMPRFWQQDTHSFKTDHFIRVRDRDPSAN